MKFTIESYDNDKHREPVILLWKEVFGYETEHNVPELVIDKKLAHGDDLFFVAVNNRSVFGTIMAGYDGHRGWIYSLAVSPAVRKQRVGSRLLEFAEQKLTDLGCLKINLQILSSNEGVQKFYISNGYQTEERISMGKRLPQHINLKARGAKMKYVEIETHEGIATILLARGKVNALNETVIEELNNGFKSLESDPDVKAIVITGTGKFFSFGFDIPEFLSFSREAFTDYLFKFTDLYTTMFLYPKPIVAALNGHTIAGGCMLALACDHRVMVSGKGKISLNEIAFGSSVFAGSTEMLRFWIGSAQATRVLYSGHMYSAEEAMTIGLVHEVATEGSLMDQAKKAASDLASKHAPAFASIKALLRKPIAADMMKREKESIQAFVEIWYSEETWENLKKIKIY
jgi:enoyl-CoA hydratase/carnithine racemase/ribosomal protein S18 acetylase RimI-like enzyme